MILFAGFSFLVINKILLQHSNFPAKKSFGWNCQTGTKDSGCKTSLRNLL